DRPVAGSGVQVAPGPPALLCRQRQVAGRPGGPPGRLFFIVVEVALDRQGPPGFRTHEPVRSRGENPATGFCQYIADGPALSGQNLNPSVARISRSFRVTPGAG